MSGNKTSNSNYQNCLLRLIRKGIISIELNLKYNNNINNFKVQGTTKEEVPSTTKLEKTEKRQTNKEVQQEN